MSWWMSELQGQSIGFGKSYDAFEQMQYQAAFDSTFDAELSDAQKRLLGSGVETDKKALRVAVEDFEAFMIQKLWEGLKQTVPEGGFFRNSFESKSYEAMLMEQYSKLMAGAGGIGLGDIMYDQLSQETSEPEVR